MRCESRLLVVGMLALAGFIALAAPALGAAKKPTFRLLPAVAVEAEDFTVEKGWQIVQNGQGNYMVDMIGFQHIGGERLLCVGKEDVTASAHKDVQVPVAGRYHLWVRYECPSFCDMRFNVSVHQGGKQVARKLMGRREGEKYQFNAVKPAAQYDASWGSEGLALEVLAVDLAEGPARLVLEAAEQPLVPGRTAGRHIDFIYLSSDTEDLWRTHYRRRNRLYPILDAFRDTVGARWEIRITNRGEKPAQFSIGHTYNRVPWGAREAVRPKVAPGASSQWLPLSMQDTAHFGLTHITGRGASNFEVALRPVGGEPVRTLKSDSGAVRVYLPPYPGRGDEPITPVEEINAVLELLRKSPNVGRRPTRPLCYGGWIPGAQQSDYGRKYAELYAAIGMRSLQGVSGGSPQQAMANLEAFGVEPTRSYAVGAYRNPPLPSNIAKAKERLEKSGMMKYVRFFDYGDEIHFGAWLNYKATVDRGTSKKSREEIYSDLWKEWLAKHRPNAKPEDYWLKAWGDVSPAQLRPDSSSAAAAENPRLYVDSILFFEEAAIDFVAEGRRQVKETLGEEVLCGANYSAHPFYYPGIAMYVKWFRGGAADMGRHSEYFWQVGQLGPMINGYIAEHFRCGMRDNPQAVNRQYTMPHIPGNTNANFLRTAFTHLAHGSQMLDFFGIGMNECFTENHIDHRAHQRYRAIRDVTHSIGLVEDKLLEARAPQSEVAMLLSDSTERWDFAQVARNFAGHNTFGEGFRNTRLSYHVERVGIWKALQFLGAAPDLLIEEDISAERLKGYRVLYLVGDSFPLERVEALAEWVRGGGVLFATAGAGRYGTYREPNKALSELLGITGRKIEEKDTFMRMRLELPFLEPMGMLAGKGWQMPRLATKEIIRPSGDAEVLGYSSAEKSPSVIARKVGKGKVYYVAALPGVAYLWSALQPPMVPDRGPNVHTLPTEFDAGAETVIAMPLKAAGIDPLIVSDLKLIDARLLKAPETFIIPIANYSGETGQKVMLSVRLPAAPKKVTSAYHGELQSRMKDGRCTIVIPALGYGDVIRCDM